MSKRGGTARPAMFSIGNTAEAISASAHNLSRQFPVFLKGHTMTGRERAALENLERRGFKVAPFGKAGKAWRVLGAGTDILTTTLSSLSAADLAPAMGFSRNQAMSETA